MKYGTQPIDPQLGIRSTLLKWLPARPALSFNATTLTAARAWQRKARRAFTDALGDMPKRVPLRAQVLERKQMQGYYRTTLTLSTAAKVKALCWLCVPDGITKSNPAPAMIATPGHGLGAKDLLAINAKGKPRPEGMNYQKDHALQAVRLGYVVLVIEPLGFGERRDAAMLQNKTAETGCQAAFNIATMLGHTLAGLRINDISRGIDYLQRDVPQANPNRIGMMGISGGGQMTLWTTAIEPRIKAAVVSGYFNSFAASAMAMPHCVCNFIPGVARKLDMTDLAALIAPRPLLIEAGTKDQIFPIKATRAALTRARKHYRIFNAADGVWSDIFQGGHQWSGRKLKKFLATYL